MGRVFFLCFPSTFPVVLRSVILEFLNGKPLPWSQNVNAFASHYERHILVSILSLKIFSASPLSLPFWLRRLQPHRLFSHGATVHFHLWTLSIDFPVCHLEHSFGPIQLCGSGHSLWKDTDEPGGGGESEIGVALSGRCLLILIATLMVCISSDFVD